MEEFPEQLDLIYRLDERPPFGLTILYSLQWLIIFLPNISVLSTVVGELFGLSPSATAVFFERTLVISGLTIMLQTWRGHRLPIVEGPAMALLLAMAAASSAGLETSAGGIIVGGLGLFLLSALKLTRFLLPLFTPRVIGVILILISLTVVPYLTPMLIGLDEARPQGDPLILLLSVSLILLMSAMSFWFRGWMKTLSLFLGIAVGTAVFGLSGLLDLSKVAENAWIGCPDLIPRARPRFDSSVILAFILAYLAVLANSAGSIVSLGQLLGAGNMEKRLDRGLAVTGISGVLAGLSGVIGLVPYSNSPGVVSVTRVGSRFVLTITGLLLVLLTFSGKITAMFTAVPDAVAAAALMTAMAAQLGVSLKIIQPEGHRLTSRDFLVVGLPVLIGIMAGLFPPAFTALMPTALRPILSNGMVVGLILVLVLEHILLRNQKA